MHTCNGTHAKGFVVNDSKQTKRVEIIKKKCLCFYKNKNLPQTKNSNDVHTSFIA